MNKEDLVVGGIYKIHDIEDWVFEFAGREEDRISHNGAATLHDRYACIGALGTHLTAKEELFKDKYPEGLFEEVTDEEKELFHELIALVEDNEDGIGYC